MNAANVRSRLPALIIPTPDRHGYTLASVSFIKRPSADPVLKDVLRVTMSFLDGNVTAATMVYADSVNWESDTQFRQQVAKSMNLDGAWQWFEGVAVARQMRCRLSSRKGASLGAFALDLLRERAGGRRTRPTEKAFASVKLN